MLTNLSSSVFSNSDSIGMVPVVSAEWNHNLFNPPYITTAGTGVALSSSYTSCSGTVLDAGDGEKKNFTTKKFTMSGGKGYVTYTVTADDADACKIVTYIKTDDAIPVMITTSARGSGGQFGSAQEEASSLGWTKVVTNIGSPASATSGISSFTFTIYVNSLSGTGINPVIYFTLPQSYKTSSTDYKYGSLWPTDAPFTYFRPGESYVGSGNTNISFPSNYRKISSSIINGYTSANYFPVSPVVQMPSFFFASPPVPGLKSAPPTDISPYKYFVSGQYTKSITAIYEKSILTNKIVLKFNTLVTAPTINLTLNGTLLTVDGSQSITFPTNSESFRTGVLTLYWTGSAWTKTKWSEMPKFGSDGTISKTTGISKITVTQVSETKRSEFTSYTSTDAIADFARMQVIEISPRLEVDVSDFVQSLSIDKSIDSQNSALPLSSVNSNSCNITLSAIPLLNNNQPVNVFSSQSDQTSTVLSNILRKNIKFYVNFNVFQYSQLSASSTTSASAYIPAGVFYSDTWDENDIDTVSVQSFDISRYLQATPVPDYVANLKSVFDIITNILDLAGFTDYDYDSLYSICNNKAMPMDVSYFYCNSKDSTVLDTLNKIFVAYQIGAYIDEYGIMRFLSLHNILSSSGSSLTLEDKDVKQGGFSVSNKAKPGKVSLRYQVPKVKQSPSLQNVTNPMIKNSPSFIYTTSNDVVWQQQSIDSVGFNYLKDSMAVDSNVMNINVNDLQNIFHTFNRDANGYAFIENEIVSFLYKEYTLAKADNTSVTVSVKNDLELQSEINNFIKEYSVGLKISYATITNVSGNGSKITYTAANSFKVGQRVSVGGINPANYNVNGIITDVSGSLFKIASTEQGTYVSGGEATSASDYDVIITPTGNITNVQRGLFGTSPSAHARITNLGSKALSEKVMNTSLALSASSGYTSIVDNNSSDASLPSISKIRVASAGNDRVLLYPTNELDIGYQTYSVKFDMPDQDVSAAGLFFNMASATSSTGMYMVELIRFRRMDPKTDSLYSPAKYRYILVIWGPGVTSSYWADVSGQCESIVNNFPKIIKKNTATSPTTYSYVTDNPFNLKVTHYLSDGTDGENATAQSTKRILSVFLNNIEITGWNERKDDDYNATTNPGGSGWKATEVNRKTGMRQKPYFTDNIATGTKFGFYATTNPVTVEYLYPGFDFVLENPVLAPASLREIHATEKPLKERSVSYFYQDREFLNGLVQGQPLYGNSRTYIMQTTPEISGINYYDIQYTTPAAVSVDVLPVEYMWYYFPGNEEGDQRNYQKKLIDEYSLAYSTPINTGFRAKMAIANNSSNVVFLHKEADDLDQFTINLNLWTHEIVAPSDPEILEAIIDPSNISEVAQLDSEWIQSRQAAQRMLKVISMGIEGFSKTVSLNIFGNPLIQVGDVVTLTYSLNGISSQRYVVSSVNQTFEQGLSTRLTLNRIQ
jgi:hypothetical protein